MAAPSYTEDLTDIDLAESGSTGWTAFNISGGGGGAPAFGADLGMQGAGCWDKAASNAERGLAVNKTPGTGTVVAGVHIFQWGFCATPGITDTLATRGAYVIIGTSTTNFMQFHVEGNDTYGALGRVGKCYVVDYHTTANTGSIPYATSNGTPGATPTYFGFGLKTTATAKGSNIGADAVRYGTGAYITAGELLSAGDASDDPASFVGFNIQNDSINNRWGILTSIGGTSYELQGRFVIGQNNGGTATACSFKDSGRSISLVDTVHSATDFTQIIIDHASTWVEWDNIFITALGQWNPGQLQVTSANPEFQMTGGGFTDIGVSVLRSNTTADGTTWRGCDEVTANGATLANSSIFHGSKIIDAQDETNYASPSAFDGGSGHVASDVITLDDGTRVTVDAVSTGVVTQFTIDSVLSKVGGATLAQSSTTGTGTGFSLTPDTQNYTESSGLIWDTAADPNGELDDMTFGTLTPPMTHAIEFGTNVPTTMTLTGCAFGTDYSATEDGSTGNETFWFRDGSPTAITLNLVNCTGNFGYKTDGAVITIVADPVTTTVTVNDNNGAPLLGARVILETSDATGDLPFEETPVSITRSGTTATVDHTGHGVPDGKKVVIRGATDTLYNGVFVISVTDVDTYTYTMNGTPAASPASGTITISGVMLEGTTDSSGQISDSRTITLAQPLKGRVSKGTSSPIFKDAPLSGTKSPTLGLTLTAQLTLDE
jgi:hypothetical protein